ncbi:uncharacterized protein Smp_202280 [Schistosoma mansoni]|uniref:uncharacterized protein n=1 Tax=Schistosoma mansoni TaxID=6183 RepID=UPI00022DC6E2|nr:uncharacterized protein Smp_202280 [Schistosoma mansoni]|eukprot:XP_018651503.1 uncharacterized protein Smp_202280 [Schistosoma mansoni]
MIDYRGSLTSISSISMLLCNMSVKISTTRNNSHMATRRHICLQLIHLYNQYKNNCLL